MENKRKGSSFKLMETVLSELDESDDNVVDIIKLIREIFNNHKKRLVKSESLVLSLDSDRGKEITKNILSALIAKMLAQKALEKANRKLNLDIEKSKIEIAEEFGLTFEQEWQINPFLGCVLDQTFSITDDIYENECDLVNLNFEVLEDIFDDLISKRFDLGLIALGHIPNEISNQVAHKITYKNIVGISKFLLSTGDAGFQICKKMKTDISYSYSIFKDMKKVFPEPLYFYALILVKSTRIRYG